LGNYFQDGEAGRQPYHSGELSGQDALQGVSQLLTERRGVDFAHEAAILDGRVDRPQSREYGEVRASLELVVDPLRFVLGISDDKTQRDCVRRRILRGCLTEQYQASAEDRRPKPPNSRAGNA
jgi:hypothetical protein